MPTSSPLRKLGITVLLLVAAGVLWWGGTKKADDPDPTALDVAVQTLAPLPDSPSVPRQQPIGVNLVPGWTGVLVVNGTEIPEDELQRDPRQPNVFSFQPGPGKAIEVLPAGQVVVRAVIWPELEGRDTGSHSFSWTFRVS